MLRCSGPSLGPLVAAWLAPLGDRPLAPGGPRRVAVRGPDGEGVDDGVATWRRGPSTYTGEDTLEVTLHGNPLLVERALAGALAAGARLADPGEFTKRALLAGKVDLLAAEATDQLVRASTSAGLAIARAGLSGAVAAVVAPLREALLDVAAELEARLDYPADELALCDDDALVTTLAEIAVRCEQVAAEAEVGRRRIDGVRVALVGAVNAGKSSIFNRLVGETRALVHPSPGTTRDVLEIPCQIGPFPVTLLDTAGERETPDPIEAAGLALALVLLADVDLLVVVLRASDAGPDAAETLLLARTADRRRVVVCNGVDRPGVQVPRGAIPTSALTGLGFDALAGGIADALSAGAPEADRVRLGSARQRDLLSAVAGAAREAAVALPLAGPAVAAELVTAALGEIDTLVGRDPREEVLTALFRRFCIGK